MIALAVVNREDMEKALASRDWREVREFYLTTFESFLELNAAFKVNHKTGRTEAARERESRRFSLWKILVTTKSP